MRLLPTLACLLPLTAWAADGPGNDAELKTALRRVLAHGDLSDLPYLSKTLGLGLRVLKPDLRNQYIDPTTNFRAIATKSPPSLLASSLSYSVEFITSRQSSRVELEFSTRTCPPLREWSKEWNIRLDRSFDPHGAGESQQLQWPGPEGIALEVFSHSRGGCSASLRQIVPRRVRLVAPESVKAVAGALSIGQIADLLAAGDLRDYGHVARILRTELIPLPGATQAGLLYSGSIELARVIPGVDPAGSAYYGDDTGWVAPPSFTRAPRALAEREVNLVLIIDSESTCLPPSRLDSELQRRAIDVSTRRPDGRQPIYSVTGENLIELDVAAPAECLEQLRFRQVTSVAQSVKTPAMFPVRESLDEASSSLTLAATQKIDAIMKHVSALERVPLKQIGILQCQDSIVTASEREAAVLLASRIQDAFASKGIAAEKIVRGTDVDPQNALDCGGRIIGERDDSGPIFVVVTVQID
jgi:hypothetical protein